MEIVTSETANMPSILPKDYLVKSFASLYETGLPRGLETSIKGLDDICRLDKGRLVTVTGVPNHGKSEFVDFLVSTYNKRYGFKTLFFSPENQPIGLHLEKLVRKFTNKKFGKETLTEAEMRNAIDYISDNFFFFNYERITKLGDIVQGAEDLVREKGIDILVIDAYNKVESEMPNGEMETNFVSKVLDKLCSFAIKNNVIVFLVAHPRKMEWDDAKKAYKCPRAYDINGSANFYNKSDFCITIHRDFSKDEVLVRVDKVKFSNYGKPSECRLKYDVVSGNYYEPDAPFAYHEDDDEGYHPIPFDIPQAPAFREPLDVEVSRYSGATDNIGTSVNLKQFLFSDEFKDVAEEIRCGKTPEERHEIKNRVKGRIPCVTIGGKFSKRDTAHIEKYSNLIGLDIDLKDNQGVMQDVPSIMSALPYVAYCGKSISGDGYFAICEIADSKDFKAHFLALQEDIKNLGITIDPQCKDITRLRFASYDPHAYYNPFAETYTKVYVEKPKTAPIYSRSTYEQQAFTSSSTEVLENAIRDLKASGGSIPDDYKTWFNLSMSLSTLGEAGRSYFHELSSASSKYDPATCDEHYDRVLSSYSSNNEFTLGTAIKIIKDSTLNLN